MITNCKIYTFDKAKCARLTEVLIPSMPKAGCKTWALPDYVFDNVLNAYHNNVTNGFYWTDEVNDTTFYIPLYFVEGFEVINTEA